jgi:hypothetical protein
MLAVTEPGVHKISVMVCTQLMKTALLENTFGYFAHLDPGPMLLQGAYHPADPRHPGAPGDLRFGQDAER